MTIYRIEFSDRDTAPDRMQEIADFHGITVEMLIHRYIAQGLSGNGLREVSGEEQAKMTHISEFLEASSALKPKK